MARDLEGLLGADLQGLWWNGNSARTNTIFGAHWKLLAGAGAVEETIGGARVFFPPGAFGQSNLDLADRLVADLHSRVADGASVAELYCGVGAIGLGLLPRTRGLLFNEVSPQGLLGLELGLAALPEPLRARAGLVAGDAAEAASMLRGADCVIVDPPRKGLDVAVIEALRSSPPRQLLYVSCEPASLRRDVAALVGESRLGLLRLTPYALFPNTGHVETLAELRSDP